MAGGGALFNYVSYRLSDSETQMKLTDSENSGAEIVVGLPSPLGVPARVALADGVLLQVALEIVVGGLWTQTWLLKVRYYMIRVDLRR